MEKITLEDWGMNLEEIIGIWIFLCRNTNIVIYVNNK
jgi:hypothetical protein